MKNILLKITRIKNETSTSKTFFFESVGQPVKYKAGQFLTLILNIDGKEVRRSYSLGSTYGLDDVMFITFKRIENGAVSRFMFDKLKEGDLLEALAPSGRFTLGEKAELYFFIAAGSGITPVFSLVKELLYRHRESRIILIYQSRSEAETIYRNELHSLAETFAGTFTLIEFFSQPIGHQYFPGRLNNYAVEQLVAKHVNTIQVLFYLCGPKQFMRMAEFTLKVMGYKNGQIKKENFVVDHIPPPPFVIDPSDKEVRIHFNNKVYLLRVAYPHNILEVALKQGIQLPYSCKGGRCSTCAATCLKGKVKMSINEVLTEKDLSKGLVLTCVGYPETDVELLFE